MNEIFHYLKFISLPPLSKNWEKYAFHWEKWNFEPIGNSVHTAEFLPLGKALNIYIDCLTFYPSRQHEK